MAVLSLACDQPFVRVDGVKKAFPMPAPGWLGFLRRAGHVTVLRDVSFDVAAGEVFGLLGENGAGKTTILHVLAGLVTPDSGSVTTGGRVGLCTGADRSFYYRLTLVENLQFFGALAGLRGRALQQKIHEVLDRVDLREMADRTYGRCSSGMRQRANIARALLADPPLVLLDEPTRTLDPIHAHAVHALIKDRLVRELRKTVVLATNSLEEAWTLCDRVAVLKDGRIESIRRPSARQRPVFGEIFGSVVACDA